MHGRVRVINLSLPIPIMGLGLRLGRLDILVFHDGWVWVNGWVGLGLGGFYHYNSKLYPSKINLRLLETVRVREEEELKHGRLGGG